MVDEHLSSMYRLGKQLPGKSRTIKIHFNCENFCQHILQNTRKLGASRLYNNIVIQADLTPLQRTHLKSLVQEKKERNQYAIQCKEDPDWVIRMGKLCRKGDLWTCNKLLTTKLLMFMTLFLGYANACYYIIVIVQWDRTIGLTGLNNYIHVMNKYHIISYHIITHLVHIGSHLVFLKLCFQCMFW